MNTRHTRTGSSFFHSSCRRGRRIRHRSRFRRIATPTERRNTVSSQKLAQQCITADPSFGTRDQYLGVDYTHASDAIPRAIVGSCEIMFGATGDILLPHTFAGI